MACFTVVVGHCRFHSSGVCLLQQSSQLTQPREDAHCVFAAGNWTERNAAMTQEQHFDQGEMVDGRAATWGRRKITVRCREEYAMVLRTHATLLPTITSRVGRTVVRGPCAEALEQRAPGSSFQHVVCARSNAARGATRRRTRGLPCYVQDDTQVACGAIPRSPHGFAGPVVNCQGAARKFDNDGATTLACPL